MLDPITLGVVVFVLAIISAIVMTITWKMNIQERGLNMWAWAAIIGGLGFLPLLFVSEIGSYAAVLNNIATLLTPILILEGIMRFKGFKKERLRLIIYIITIVMTVSFIVLFREMPNARFLIFDSVVTAIFFFSAFSLLWKSTGLERKVYMITAAAFVLIGCTFAGRWFLALNGSFEANFAAHPYTSFLFFMVIIWTVGWTYGLSIAVNVRNHNRVMKLATHDYLTGLPNRKYLDSYIELLLKSPAKRPFVLYSLDLNGFKQINDLYGHKTGDDVLIKMAESLRDFAWGEHTAVRLGGDEFVVIMQQSIDKKSISHTKKALREAVENDKKIDAGTIILKTSIGYAVYPSDGQTMDELLSKADAQMYKEKAYRKACSEISTAEFQI